MRARPAQYSITRHDPDIADEPQPFLALLEAVATRQAALVAKQAAGWKGRDLKFDHNSAKYRLEGKHANVACDKCHKPQTPGANIGTAVFTGMKFGLCYDLSKAYTFVTPQVVQAVKDYEGMYR